MYLQTNQEIAFSKTASLINLCRNSDGINLAATKLADV